MTKTTIASLSDQSPIATVSTLPELEYGETMVYLAADDIIRITAPKDTKPWHVTVLGTGTVLSGPGTVITTYGPTVLASNSVVHAYAASETYAMGESTVTAHDSAVITGANMSTVTFNDSSSGTVKDMVSATCTDSHTGIVVGYGASSIVSTGFGQFRLSNNSSFKGSATRIVARDRSSITPDPDAVAVVEAGALTTINLPDSSASRTPQATKPSAPAARKEPETPPAPAAEETVPNTPTPPPARRSLPRRRPMVHDPSRPRRNVIAQRWQAAEELPPGHPVRRPTAILTSTGSRRATAFHYPYPDLPG